MNSPNTTATILLVEDNPADAGLVRKALELHGVEGEIMVAVDGQKAIELIESIDNRSAKCPDLAIIDLNLPRRSGRDVLEAMRRSGVCSAVPIVILSSSDAHQDKADAARLGASRYLRKPTRLDEFMGIGAVLKEMISKADR